MDINLTQPITRSYLHNDARETAFERQVPQAEITLALVVSHWLSECQSFTPLEETINWLSDAEPLVNQVRGWSA